MKPTKHQVIMKQLLDEVEEKYGEAKVQEYITKFKPLALQGMNREIVCQVISAQAWYRTLFFLVMYPSYILPYLIRIRGTKAPEGQPA